MGRLSVAGSVVDEADEVSADAVLDSVDGGIEVSADVSAPWSGECRRCLKPVRGRLQVHVRELYREHRHPSDKDDEETYPLRGEMLNLKPLVSDAILLDLPLAPLCSESCKGLCATCGADLNDGPCVCDPVPTDPRWAALDALQPGRVERGSGA